MLKNVLPDDFKSKSRAQILDQGIFYIIKLNNILEKLCCENSTLLIECIKLIQVETNKIKLAHSNF